MPTIDIFPNTDFWVHERYLGEKFNDINLRIDGEINWRERSVIKFPLNALYGNITSAILYLYIKDTDNFFCGLAVHRLQYDGTSFPTRDDAWKIDETTGGGWESESVINNSPIGSRVALKSTGFSTDYVGWVSVDVTNYIKEKFSWYSSGYGDKNVVLVLKSDIEQASYMVLTTKLSSKEGGYSPFLRVTYGAISASINSVAVRRL